MKTIPDLDWNEIVIVRLHEGQTTCWKGWRRSIAEFADPATWNQPESWAQRFEPLDDSHTWGFAGYGFIAVDMDGKRSWSINDYQVPGSVYLPSDVMPGSDAERKPLLKLLETPASWPMVKLEAFDNATSERLSLPLSDLLSEEQSLEQRLEQVTVRRGTINVGGRKVGPFNVGTRHLMVVESMFSPDQWVQSTDRGQDEPFYTMQTLETMRTAGFEAPDWDSIREKVSSQADDLDDEERDEVMEQLETMAALWGPSKPGRHP